MTGDLARLRFPLEASRGRRYPEPAHPYRNDFQRDRDRIVHSRAFRRLEDKTQVFSPDLSDHFRTRLTHTLEVTQIARTAASALGLNEDLAEALALVHDAGHPPFGHAGEAELDRQMRRHGDRFDHNLHALRIVESFEQRYARFPGLNLTFEVREGIVKHSRDVAPGDGLDEYLPGLRPPLESQLIDLCDEIAYNTADVDDGISAGLFAMEDAASSSPMVAAISEAVLMQFPGAPERVRVHETLRALIDRLTSGLVSGTASAAEGLASSGEVRRAPARLARFDEDAGAACRQLKAFLHARLYSSPALVAERERSVALVADLFEFYMKDFARLPEAYRERASGEPPHRVVCDYIAGMTDGFFRRTCAAMLGAPSEPRPPS